MPIRTIPKSQYHRTVLPERNYEYDLREDQPNREAEVEDGRSGQTSKQRASRPRISTGIVLRTVLVVLTALLAIKAVFRAATREYPAVLFPDPRTDLSRTINEPRIQTVVEAELVGRGVKLTAPTKALLSVILTAWEKRVDLRTLYSEPDGKPDIRGLMDWADTMPDSYASAVVPHLGAITELRGRMGVIAPSGRIVPVLYWTLQNRRHPFSTLDPVIGRISDLWRERPELQERFVTDGVVDVRALLTWVNDLPTTDPYFMKFFWQYFEIDQALLELPATNGEK